MKASGDHGLGGSIRLEPAHRSGLAFELTVVDFDRIVGVLVKVVPRRQQQLVEDGQSDRCGVGDHLGRDHFEGGHCPGEETPGSGQVTPTR